MTIGIAVAGACGRMGKGIIKAVTAQPDMGVVLAIDVKHIGEDVGEVAGIGTIGANIIPPEDLENWLKKSGAKILVDFTNPQVALRNAKIAAGVGCSLIIGTTGFKEEDLEEIRGYVRGGVVSAVISPNMATGVNVFFKLVRDAAISLGDGYDVEIMEVHHRHKKDAPSGTALRAAEYIAEATGRDSGKEGVYGRRGIVGERKAGEVGFHAVRAGDVIGEHTVLFAGEEERIEITHRAQSREAFVGGVTKAIRFLMDKGVDGKTYSMWDVLGIR